MANVQSALKRLILKQKVLQKLFGKKTSIRNSWAETPKTFKDIQSYLNWFNSAPTLEAQVEQANRDWAGYFKSHPGFADLSKNRAMEIGFGGGRLLLAASKDFKEVLGIDIHESFDKTAEFLMSQNLHSFQLVQRDAWATVPAGSVDFIFSFIVFQHFDSFKEVEFYLTMIEKLLSPNGRAMIYYAKSEQKEIELTEENEFILRDCSLFIQPNFMKEAVQKQFILEDSSEKVFKDPPHNTKLSQQAWVLLKKK